MKKYYEVRTFEVETKNGMNVEEVWFNKTNQDTTLVKAFENLEEAKAFYKTIKTECRYMSGYYLSTCKCIEENVYDEDGECVEGGDWIDADLPEIN